MAAKRLRTPCEKRSMHVLKPGETFTLTVPPPLPLPPFVMQKREDLLQTLVEAESDPEQVADSADLADDTKSHKRMS